MKKTRKVNSGHPVKGELNVTEVLRAFEKSDKALVHRRGGFKIEVPFEEALGTILKAKPTKRPLRNNKS